MIAPGLQRRLRVLSAWGYLVVQRLCSLCCFCFFVSWVVVWCFWWFARADFVSPVTSSPTRPAYCATDVVKGRQSKKKKSKLGQGWHSKKTAIRGQHNATLCSRKSSQCHLEDCFGVTGQLRAQLTSLLKVGSGRTNSQCAPRKN